MNTLINLAAVLSILWLSMELSMEYAEPVLAVAVLGLALAWVIVTGFEFMDEAFNRDPEESEEAN
jgi:hypothetical protein